jgi:hypothetical protein
MSGKPEKPNLLAPFFTNSQENMLFTVGGGLRKRDGDRSL